MDGGKIFGTYPDLTLDGPDDVGLYKQVAEKLAELSGSDGSADGVTGASAAEFIDAQIRAGRDVLIRDGKTGETQLVRIL